MSYIEKNEKLNQAIIYATERHAGQLRKGSTKPAIVHSLETMMILDHMEADIDLMIAGVLHDTVEDTTATIEEIREIFGDEIAHLVWEHTEDKTRSWQERKQQAIKSLNDASFEVKILVLADKISNMRDILADYRKIGDQVWNHFSVGKEKQAWYYSGIQDALYDMQYYENTASYYWEMVAIFKDIFVNFYIDWKNERIYQYCAEGSCYYLQKGSYYWQEWKAYDVSVFSAMEEVERIVAEQLEDSWNDDLDQESQERFGGVQ